MIQRLIDLKGEGFEKFQRAREVYREFLRDYRTMVSFRCPRCRKELRVATGLLMDEGELKLKPVKALCPDCRQILQLPSEQRRLIAEKHRSEE